ncbi:hypothetical protein LTR75_004486 [Friedmanniomyces endolithicus]|nr:hypothetical protein LTR75_004486 [Friedmanniomyces endolithicus]
MANPPPQHNSYLPLYTPPQVAHHEWRTASNSAAYLLPSLSALATSTPNLRLLDVGCGSGTISTSLAALIPSGSVTATDISPEILARAKDLAAKAGVANISFQEADIYASPSKTGRSTSCTRTERGTGGEPRERFENVVVLPPSPRSAAGSRGAARYDEGGGRECGCRGEIGGVGYGGGGGEGGD